ncbi:MAG: response regulator transcription factor [Planctomycetota bacterium]|jgi:DNA-binding NarL/FixJ family response regulator
MYLQSDSEQSARRKKGRSDDLFCGRPDVVLLNDKQWSYVQRLYRMSPRELQIARLVCRGFSNGDIAKKLSVRPGTVKTHLRSIFNKTRVRNKITMLLRCLEKVEQLSAESSHPVHLLTGEGQKLTQETASPETAG